MSIEAKIEANTKALEANTEAVLRHNELLGEILSKAGTTIATTKPAGTKAAATKSAPKDAEEKPARTRRSAKPKIDVKAIKELATEFVDVEDDDEYEARSAIVKGVSKTFDVEKVTEVSKDDAEDFHAALTKAIEGYLAEDEPEDEKPSRRRRDDV